MIFGSALTHTLTSIFKSGIQGLNVGLVRLDGLYQNPLEYSYPACIGSDNLPDFNREIIISIFHEYENIKHIRCIFVVSSLRSLYQMCWSYDVFLCCILDTT